MENVYAFKPVVKRNPSIPNQTSSFENEFNFCNFNDGYDENDLKKLDVIHVCMFPLTDSFQETAILDLYTYLLQVNKSDHKKCYFLK